MASWVSNDVLVMCGRDDVLEVEERHGLGFEDVGLAPVIEPSW